MATAICLGCDEDIGLPGRLRRGQMVICHHCGAQLQVVDVNPPMLDWTFEEHDVDEDELENEEGFEDNMTEHLDQDEQEEL